MVGNESSRRDKLKLNFTTKSTKDTKSELKFLFVPFVLFVVNGSFPAFSSQTIPMMTWIPCDYLPF